MTRHLTRADWFNVLRRNVSRCADQVPDHPFFLTAPTSHRAIRVLTILERLTKATPPRLLPHEGTMLVLKWPGGRSYIVDEEE
jgi:hypothetical protein